MKENVCVCVLVVRNCIVCVSDCVSVFMIVFCVCVCECMCGCEYLFLITHMCIRKGHSYS